MVILMSDRLPGSSQSYPIQYRGWLICIGHDGRTWEYAHTDYDESADAFDSRCGYAASVDAAKRAIDIYENADDEFENHDGEMIL